MNKIMKKIVAVLLIVTMIAGAWGVLPNTAKAEEATIQKTGVITGLHNTSKNGSTELYFHPTNPIDVSLESADYPVFKPISQKGLISKNGVGNYISYMHYFPNLNAFRIITSDIVVGDVIEVYGRFSTTAGTVVQIEETVMQCVAMTSGNKPQWELVRSGDRVATESDTYLSIHDFGITQFTNSTGLKSVLSSSASTLVGKTFVSNIKFAKTENNKKTTIWYGTTNIGWNNGIAIIFQANGTNQNTVSIYDHMNSATIGNTVTLTDEQFAKNNVLKISVSEVGTDNSGTITVTINGEPLLNEQKVENINKLDKYLFQNAGIPFTCTDYIEVIEKATEITLDDFGLADDIYQNVTGTYPGNYAGKRFVIKLEVSDEDVKVNRWISYHGATLQTYLRNSDNLPIITQLSSQNLWTTFTARKQMVCEMYMDYIDSDNDGLQDDARYAMKIDGVLISSGGTCFREKIDARWTAAYNVHLYGQGGTGHWKASSYNTKAIAEQNGTELVIKGSGKLYPATVASAVTDPTTISKIRIEEGITSIEPKVFTGYTRLSMLMYGETLRTMATDSFVDCAVGVHIICGSQGSFECGLKDAVTVTGFDFVELLQETSKITSEGMIVDVRPSIVVKGNAAEGTKTAASTYTGLQVDINGTSTDVTLSKTSYGTLTFTIPTDQLPNTESYRVVLKSGVLSAEDNATVSYGLREDYIIYVNAAGISSNQYVTDCGTVNIKYMPNSGNYAGAFYISTTDQMPTGSVVAEDTPDSGIFLNGEKFSAVLTKMGNTYYYLSIQGNNDFRNVIVQEGLDKERHAKDGDVITICGTFRSGDSVVTFNPLSVQYSNGTWTTVTATEGKIVLPSTAINLEETGVGYTVGSGTVSVKVGNNVKDITDGTSLYLPGDYVVTRTIGDISYERSVSLYRKGDVNTDNKLNIKDLVAMMKCQDDNTDYSVAQKSATVVVESGDDKANATELRKALVGASKVITKTKDGADLPEELVGQKLGNVSMQADVNFADTYITSVSATENGTVVFGMSDTLAETPYASTKAQMTKFDDFGLDYVIDMEGVGRELKVLQITDTQIVDYEAARTAERKSQVPNVYVEGNKTALLKDYLDQTIQAADPDLILMTGDNVFGEFDDDGSELTWLVETMDSYGILWAPVFGNHDNESRMGVLWQCKQFQESKYCLFNRRHSVGGNGNYTIGLAKDGELKRTIFMMDTHECAVAYNDSKYPDKAQLSHPTTGRFVWQQMVWYREMAKRINCVADTTIPSFMAYHIPTKDVYEAEIVAGYRTEESASKAYSIGDGENQVLPAQPGDCGAMQSSTKANLKTVDMLTYMNEVGTDGAFFGHQHANSASIYYGGVRWTYGVKTGMYDTHPEDQLGGTLITLSDDCKDFAISQILINCDDNLCAGKH